MSHTSLTHLASIACHVFPHHPPDHPTISQILLRVSSYSPSISCRCRNHQHIGPATDTSSGTSRKEEEKKKTAQVHRRVRARFILKLHSIITLPNAKIIQWSSDGRLRSNILLCLKKNCFLKYLHTIFTPVSRDNFIFICKCTVVPGLVGTEESIKCTCSKGTRCRTPFLSSTALTDFFLHFFTALTDLFSHFCVFVQ